MKINFYLLKQNSHSAVQALCCKLAEQQFRQGQRVGVLTEDDDSAHEMDQLLWSFTADSFVPHALANSPDAVNATVLIGPAPASLNSSTCVLNLGSEPIDAHEGLTAIAEFIRNDEDAKAQSRVRWNHYKQLGYELQLHQL